MVSYSVSELKARLSQYLRRIKGGEEVLITERGRPVARLVPYRPDADEQLELLIEAGLVRPPSHPLDLQRLEQAPPDPERALLEAVLAEREAGW